MPNRLDEYGRKRKKKEEVIKPQYTKLLRFTDGILSTYADFEGSISEEAFELYNAAYLRVAVGKGCITCDNILELMGICLDADVTPIEG